MPRGYRSIILAAFVGLILANAAQHDNHKRGNSKNAGHAQQDIVPAPGNPPPPIQGGEADKNQCIDENGSKRDCTAAAAQATIDQASYAYWQAVAGGVGVLLGIGTLFAAWRAAHWAKRAAEHTDRGANEAASSVFAAHRQIALSAQAQRPWITIKATVKLSIAPENENMIIFDGVIIFRNIGQTVALNVVVTGGTQQDPFSIENERIIFNGEKSVLNFNKRSVIPGDYVTYRFKSMYARNIIAGMSEDGRIHLCVYALCDYQSDTTENHMTDGLWFAGLKGEDRLLDSGIPMYPLPENKLVKLYGSTRNVT